MQSNCLHANEVLASRQLRGKSEGNAGQVLSGESDRLSTVGNSGDLVDLEPDITITSPGGDFCTAGSLGHVDVDDTGVVDRVVAHDTDLLASADGDRGGGGVGRRVVATEVGASDIGDLDE